MAWDETVAERLREGLLAVEGVEEKRMFGGLCFLVRGNMACVASGRGGAFFRVGKDREAEALALPGAARMVMAGREKPGFIHFDGGSLEESLSCRHWWSSKAHWYDTRPAFAGHTWVSAIV